MSSLCRRSHHRPNPSDSSAWVLRRTADESLRGYARVPCQRSQSTYGSSIASSSGFITGDRSYSVCVCNFDQTTRRQNSYNSLPYGVSGGYSPTVGRIPPKNYVSPRIQRRIFGYLRAPRCWEKADEAEKNP